MNERILDWGMKWWIYKYINEWEDIRLGNEMMNI